MSGASASGSQSVKKKRTAVAKRNAAKFWKIVDEWYEKQEYLNSETIKSINWSELNSIDYTKEELKEELQLRITQSVDYSSQLQILALEKDIDVTGAEENWKELIASKRKAITAFNKLKEKENRNTDYISVINLLLPHFCEGENSDSEKEDSVIFVDESAKESCINNEENNGERLIEQ